jgi:hypothetical protein
MLQSDARSILAEMLTSWVGTGRTKGQTTPAITGLMVNLSKIIASVALTLSEN